VTLAPAAAPPAAPATPAACPSGMVRIGGGAFFMGSDDGTDAERPAHRVTVTTFCIDVSEVSVGAYLACAERGDCKRAPTTNAWPGISAKDSATYDALCNARDPVARKYHPINCVGWNDAARYCAASGKRLPTEAEWEFAARGSEGRTYPWGDEAPTVARLNACGAECQAWSKKAKAGITGALYAVEDGWPSTAPVGSFPAGRSRAGLEDLAGNVFEWVADRFASYSADEVTDPSGPAEGSERVIRGGAWNSVEAGWVRASFRFKSAPETRTHGIGFRCAASL
jgi:formylglycine-generating enzyme required for sulfatase activity